MPLHRTLRKATELGIGLTAIATLILAGCGGGGSSAASSSSSTVSAVTTSVTPYKGRFTNGAVILKDANGNTITLLNGSGSINASGVATVSYNGAGVAYPLTVEVTGTYIDETTGASAVIAAGSPLRGLIPALSDAQAASGVPVTAVTDIARATLPATGFSAASAVAAITGAASSVLGIASYAAAMQPPVFNAQGQTADPVTLKLTALAHVVAQQGSGATLHLKLQDVAAKLAAGSAVNAVIPQTAFQNALTAINTVGGASGVVPAGVTPPAVTPPTLPGNPLNSLIAGAIPSCASGQTLQHTANGLECVGATSGSTPSVPAAPTGVTATVASSTQINLSWSAATGAQGYRIYRSTTPGQQITAMTDVLGGPVTIATNYNDTGLTAGTTYYYKIVAANATGNSNASTEVNATTQTAGNSGGNAYVTPSNLGTLTASDAGAAQFGSTFSPTTLTASPGIGLGSSYKWEVSSTWFVMLNASTVTINNGNMTWQKPLAPLTQLSYDAVNGTITFTNMTTTTAVGGATGPLVLNGTLNIAPLNSGPVSMTGTGIIYSGSGFDSPAATYATATGAEVWTWIDNRGSTLKLTRIVSNGSLMLQIAGLGNVPFLTTIASGSTLGIALDTTAKTATFTNVVLNNNNTSTSVTLNGTLSLP